MNCQYCGSHNDRDEHRCQRCGRRLQDDERIFPVTTGSVAPAVETFPDVQRERPPAGPQLVTAPPPASRSGSREDAYQASLFGPQEVRSGTIVSRPKPPATQTPKVRRDRPEQSRFEFDEAQPRRRGVKTTVETSIYCDAPVAIAAHRATAAVIDTLLGLVGVAVLAATAHYGGVEFQFTAANAPYYATATILVLVFYRLLFCLANGDTPGTRAAGLRVINFDGHAPSRRQRMQRFFGGFVSVSSVGLGLLWALFEEEQLTWHDLMSKTFPTEDVREDSLPRR